MTNHPITPPPELVEQWAKHILTPEEGNLTLDLDWFANQAARRLKPPSLKEQALEALKDIECEYVIGATTSTIRRALEALPND